MANAHPTIIADLLAASAARSLQDVGPTIDALDQGVHDEAFRAIVDGRMHGELAVALWHRLYATEEVRATLRSRAASASDAAQRVVRAYVTPTANAGATKE